MYNEYSIHLVFIPYHRLPGYTYNTSNTSVILVPVICIYLHNNIAYQSFSTREEFDNTWQI